MHSGFKRGSCSVGLMDGFSEVRRYIRRWDVSQHLQLSQHTRGLSAVQQAGPAPQGLDRAPNPIIAFDESGFPPPIMAELKKSGFTEPTPIQAQGWSVALKANAEDKLRSKRNK